MPQEVLALITAVLTFAGYLVQRVVKSNLAPGQLGNVLNLARTVVQAAERVGEAAKLDGPDKYAYAEQALIAAAKRVGLNLKPEEANAFIHAALREFEQARDGLNEYAEIGRLVVENAGTPEAPAAPATGAAA